MAPALLERPASSAATADEPPGSSPRSSRRWLGAAAAVLGLALLVPLGGRVLDLLPTFDPLAPTVVDRSGPALQLAMEDLGEYHAVRSRFQSVIDLERDTPWVPSAVSGERTTYLAVGSVDGVVDFAALGPGAVRTDGTSVTISLPRARLDRPVLDLEASRVVGRERGVLDRVGGVFSDSPTSERDVQRAALRKLADAAAESDLRARSEQQTRAMLIGLAQSLGFTDVTVTFDAGDGL